MVKLVEVPSYHTNSPTTFTDSHEFLLLWEKHEGTVWQYTGIHLPKSIHPYTTEYRSCLYQKMLDWVNTLWHTSKSVKRCMNMGMFDIGLSMTQLLKVTLGVTLNISNFCLRVNIFTGMRWLTLQWCRVTLVTLVTLCLCGDVSDSRHATDWYMMKRLKPCNKFSRRFSPLQEISSSWTLPLLLVNAIVVDLFVTSTCSHQPSSYGKAPKYVWYG